jgi:acyl carrier protein
MVVSHGPQRSSRRAENVGSARCSVCLRRPPATRIVASAVRSELAERRALPFVDRPDRRSADVSEDQPSNVPPARMMGHIEGGRMSPDAAGEEDRALPSRGVGEHQIGASRPRGEQEELRRPHDPPSLDGDHVAEGYSRRVHDRKGPDVDTPLLEPSHDRLGPASASQRADPAHEFGSGVCDEPRTRAVSDVAPDVDTDLIDPDVPFQEQRDLDSMDFLNYVTGLEEEAGIRIPGPDYPRVSTLSGCIEYVLAAVQARPQRGR